MPHKDPEKYREYQREYRKANREQLAENDRKYRERNHERAIQRDRAYYAANREMLIEKSRRYREANPDSRREYQAAYLPAYRARRRTEDTFYFRLKIGRERALRAGCSVPAQFWGPELLAYWESENIPSNRCYYCGTYLDWASRTSQLDHVVPISRNGPHQPENIVPSCEPCNDRKDKRTADEFLALAGAA